MVELVKIIEERFKKKNNISDTGAYHDYAKALTDYKKDKRNELAQLLKDLGLEDSLDMFKTVKGREAKVYWFYEDEVDFINRLYDEYSNPLIAVRKGQAKNLDDEYAVTLYEDILKLFIRRGLSVEEAYEKTKYTYNILDYPVRKKQLAIAGLREQMEKIINLITEERLRNITSRNDDFAWIDYVSKDMTAKVEQYMHLYDVMAELRQCEINDYAEEQYKNMSIEEQEQMEAEDFIDSQVFFEWMSMPRVRELQEDERRITGEPEEVWEKMKWVPRNDYTLKETEALWRIRSELDQLYDEAKEKVKRDLVAEKDLHPIFEKPIEYGFKGLMTSEELVDAALKEMEEEN